MLNGWMSRTYLIVSMFNLRPADLELRRDTYVFLSECK